MAGRRRAPPAAGPLPPLSVLDLAAGLGFRRVRVAERHGHRSVGSAAPPVLSARLAASTSRIRLGSGGVLLTNRAPRAVAERFTTLAALPPVRVDLGIGRGPGTPFARCAAKLGDTDGRRVLPGAGALPEPWLPASSVAGAELAAGLSLPLAVAHRIRPGNTPEALGRYRERFRASRWCGRPRVLVSVETVCA
ncbi:LLM class flavin-dependent oxidoreductase [Actinacidiphila glaucinigra]|uniref:LLM class flavin-dependent oxidoreductase n=1 Tax=Actinacidiphila glaucinigra TaxID=235986 RepID=UPI0035E20977